MTESTALTFKSPYELRKWIGFTQDHMAQMVGVSQAKYSRFEAAPTSDMKLFNKFLRVTQSEASFFAAKENIDLTIYALRESLEKIKGGQ